MLLLFSEEPHKVVVVGGAAKSELLESLPTPTLLKQFSAFTAWQLGAKLTNRICYAKPGQNILINANDHG